MDTKPLCSLNIQSTESKHSQNFQSAFAGWQRCLEEKTDVDVTGFVQSICYVCVYTVCVYIYICVCVCVCVFIC